MELKDYDCLFDEHTWQFLLCDRPWFDSDQLYQSVTPGNGTLIAISIILIQFVIMNKVGMCHPVIFALIIGGFHLPYKSTSQKLKLSSDWLKFSSI